MSQTVSAPAAPLTERRFRLLALDIAIATNCPLLDRQLDFLVQDAEQDFPLSASMRIEAVRRDGLYRIAESDEKELIEYDEVAALNTLHLRCYARANAALPPGTVFLHGASGRIAGRRFLAIGESGVGKTTLMMHLARLGMAVEGDELAALTPLGLIAVPRNFHVKSPALDQLPWLRESAASLPSFDNGNGTCVYSVAPSRLGRPWQIGRGGVDVVFFLESNHGGHPRIEPLPQYRMVELAMSQARLGQREDRSWLGPFCALIKDAATYKLVVGDLDRTAKMLINKLSG
jgi:energy-coupling factor transporter ATP-binding protein EcfA2